MSVAKHMYELIEKLYPICRSITGNGVRATLQHIQSMIPLELHEVPTATEVFDWTIPKEWNIRDAYVKNAQGERVIDFKRHNLHVLNYSIPIHAAMSLKELKPHLFTLPEQPDLIPYRTSYYQETWGFCLTHNDFLRLEDGNYEVVIDSSLEDGSLSYGEYFLAGETKEEILFSTHVCHPSLCNDNLSGIALVSHLAKYLSEQPRLRYSYRFVFIPGTIGAITWLSLNEPVTKNIRHGLVVTGLGDSSPFVYKQSRRADAEIDLVIPYVLEQFSLEHKVIPFSPYGYDERQYGSPGFDLPVGRLSRKPHGEYPEYHTSADNLDFVSAENLSEALEVYKRIVKVLEHNHYYKNLKPKGEPQLGKRGLYTALGGQHASEKQMAMLWILNLSDGKHSLLDIARVSEINFDILVETAQVLKDHDLLKEIPH